MQFSPLPEMMFFVLLPHIRHEVPTAESRRRRSRGRWRKYTNSGKLQVVVLRCKKSPWLRHAEMGKFVAFGVAFSVRIRVFGVGSWSDWGDGLLNVDGWHVCVLVNSCDIACGSFYIVDDAEGPRNAIGRNIQQRQDDDGETDYNREDAGGRCNPSNERVGLIVPKVLDVEIPSKMGGQ